MKVPVSLRLSADLDDVIHDAANSQLVEENFLRKLFRGHVCSIVTLTLHGEELEFLGHISSISSRKFNRPAICFAEQFLHCLLLVIEEHHPNWWLCITPSGTWKTWPLISQTWGLWRFSNSTSFSSPLKWNDAAFHPYMQ